MVLFRSGNLTENIIVATTPLLLNTTTSLFCWQAPPPPAHRHRGPFFVTISYKIWPGGRGGESGGDFFRFLDAGGWYYSGVGISPKILLWPPLDYHLTLPRACFVGKPPHHPLTGIGGLFFVTIFHKIWPPGAASGRVSDSAPKAGRTIPPPPKLIGWR